MQEKKGRKGGREEKLIMKKNENKEGEIRF